MSGTDTSPINSYLLDNEITMAQNPAISPDLTLDFTSLLVELESEMVLLLQLCDPAAAGGIAHRLNAVTLWPESVFTVDDITFFLVESKRNGDYALVTVSQKKLPFKNVGSIGNELKVIPLSWQNFITLKNYVLENDPSSTIFPKAVEPLDQTSLGIGARFTTLHWPAVAWVMKTINVSLTANQNSIPRELVYDVDAMLDGKLAEVPFPFIGRSVPEGHQGQSVQGMSHASVITFLKHGFHHHGIPYGFNADHQPIGGRFDEVEEKLVAGSLFASYITYDMSPELSLHQLIDDDNEMEKEFSRIADKGVYDATVRRIGALGLGIDDTTICRYVTFLTPAMEKMKKRDEAYTSIRERHFTTDTGRRLIKELSIDELPGETTPEILAVCLAMSEAMGVKFSFVAPNIGFQKNFPYEDNAALETKTKKLYAIAKAFGVSIGFHSGSGKSAENYKILGKVTEGHFEIKTSGRYTYEMGVALAQSDDSTDHQLWVDWYNFTKKLALEGAFAEDEVQRKFAREFISYSLQKENKSTEGVFDSPEKLSEALEQLPPSPDHMFWFEYNFLFVLAAQGATDKLGDHSPEGYCQRKRFYSISDQGKLLYAKQVAQYIIFLAESSGLIEPEKADNARSTLASYTQYEELLNDIS